jgi:hypothetical protein
MAIVSMAKRPRTVRSAILENKLMVSELIEMQAFSQRLLLEKMTRGVTKILD